MVRQLVSNTSWASGGMADTLVLGTSAARRKSSTLFLPTKTAKKDVHHFAGVAQW